MFGQSRTEYNMTQFKQCAKVADLSFFGIDVCSRFIVRNEALFDLSFYPLYLVNDSVFHVMACHYAVSAVVNLMSNVRLA